jgi:hypothetical protein
MNIEQSTMNEVDTRANLSIVLFVNQHVLYVTLDQRETMLINERDEMIRSLTNTIEQVRRESNDRGSSCSPLVTIVVVFRMCRYLSLENQLKLAFEQYKQQSIEDMHTSETKFELIVRQKQDMQTEYDRLHDAQIENESRLQVMWQEKFDRIEKLNVDLCEQGNI